VSVRRAARRRASFLPRRVAWVLLALALPAGAAWAVASARSPGAGWLPGSAWLAGWSTGPDLPTHVVARSEFVHRVSARGNLRAEQSIPIGVPPGVPAALKIAWTCPDGVAVRAGEVVVRFEPTELEQKLLDGQSARDTAQAKLQKERELSSLAERERERSARLSLLELQTARDFSATDPEIFSRIQIIESGVDEQLYEARRDHADRVERIEASLSKNKLEQIAVERRQAELSIAQAERGLAILELRAPEDGVIMFERDWQGNVIKVPFGRTG
jgi:multidrug efflux pump subunit AcrA (membrane-fusion protein)